MSVFDVKLTQKVNFIVQRVFSATITRNKSEAEILEQVLVQF